MYFGDARAEQLLAPYVHWVARISRSNEFDKWVGSLMSFHFKTSLNLVLVISSVPTRLVGRIVYFKSKMNISLRSSA